MSRRCMPSEWPRQTVTALVTMNRASASQVKVSGAPITPTSVMAEIQIDLTGFQRTTPSTALVSSASTMRGERNVLSDRCSASSMGSVASHVVLTGALTAASADRVMDFAPLSHLPSYSIL